jgi:hypothetical protein
MRPRRFGLPNGGAESLGIGHIRRCVLVTGADRVSGFLKRPAETIEVARFFCVGAAAQFRVKRRGSSSRWCAITRLGVHRASAVWRASHYKATIRIRIYAEGDTANRQENRMTRKQLEQQSEGVKAQMRWAALHGGDQELLDLLRVEGDRLSAMTRQCHSPASTAA